MVRKRTSGPKRPVVAKSLRRWANNPPDRRCAARQTATTQDLPSSHPSTQGRAPGSPSRTLRNLPDHPRHRPPGLRTSQPPVSCIVFLHSMVPTGASSPRAWPCPGVSRAVCEGWKPAADAVVSSAWHGDWCLPINPIRSFLQGFGQRSVVFGVAARWPMVGTRVVPAD